MILLGISVSLTKSQGHYDFVEASKFSFTEISDAMTPPNSSLI